MREKQGIIRLCEKQGIELPREQGERPMPKRQQLSTFQGYLKGRERRIKRLVAAIEKRGIEGALDRCRVLVEQINRGLRPEC